MRTTVILPAPDFDTQVRARLTHAIGICGFTPRTFAEQLGVPKSTVHRHINPKGVSASYRRGLTTDAVDGYLGDLDAEPDEILKPEISNTLRVNLYEVQAQSPRTKIPLEEQAAEAHAMGLIEVRGTKRRRSTYRLYLTPAGLRARKR